ncbi:MAG: hypothetical protein AABZ23_03890 [Deltaproteobacteria bacterium]
MFFKRSFKRTAPDNGRFKFFETGFHGDRYLLMLVDALIKDCGYFIETGANVGSTLAYVARTYPDKTCISCEPDKDAFDEAIKNTGGLKNAIIYNMPSQDFIKSIEKGHKELLEKDALFWLDAHGYGFDWPLKDELRFITTRFKRAHILIDDFKVPGLEVFSYDVYKAQVCSFDFVKDSLAPGRGYKIFYPDYTEKTSPHHPLVGWGLIEFGHAKEIFLPDILRNKIKGPIHV